MSTLPRLLSDPAPASPGVSPVIVVHTPDRPPALAVQQVLRRDATASVFVAGCRSDATVMAEAIRLGARGFVQRAAHEGLRPTAVESVRPTTSDRRSTVAADRLTARERDVLVAMSRGWSNAEIAAELGVSVSTVKVYAQHVFTKLGSRERAQAVATGFRDGILS